MSIRLAEDTVSRDDIVALSDWLLTFPRLTKGALTEEFERNFAEWAGSRYAIMVSSGSSANLIAANALIAEPRTKTPTVIVPAVSWVTTITPFLQLGYRVIMCDCDPHTLGVDVDQFEDLCRQHAPDAAIIVHVLGHDSSIEDLMAICTKYDVRLIEDSCEAIGSEIGGRKLGTFGAFGTYSMYYGHQISSIEGGVVVTDDYDLAQIAKSMRAHGWARDLDPATRQKLESENGIDPFESLYTFYYSGFNCRSTDLNAFLALRQIKLLPEIVAARHRNFEEYRAHLPNFWSQTSKTEKLSSFAYGMIVENRQDVVAALRAGDVETRPLICGSMARQPFMQKAVDPASMPHADRIHLNGLYLPNHLHLTPAEVAEISAIINKVGRPL